MIKAVKIVLALSFISVLAGCTVTGETRGENVVFNDKNMITSEKFSKAIEVGDISDFPGTSPIGVMRKTAPNFSDETFREVLSQSLENVNMLGRGYTLNAKLIDDGGWSDWGFSLGSDNRRTILIEYELMNSANNIILSKVIESTASESNYNFFKPYYLFQREVAEKSYAKNIETIIKEINEL